jgi:hypothetical protein
MPADISAFGSIMACDLNVDPRPQPRNSSAVITLGAFSKPRAKGVTEAQKLLSNGKVSFYHISGRNRLQVSALNDMIVNSIIGSPLHALLGEKYVVSWLRLAGIVHSTNKWV